MSKAKQKDPGMRRVRLIIWALYHQTPLDVEIQEWVERGVASRCKLSWEQYCEMKRIHAEMWIAGAERRRKAKVAGGFPPQPWQLRLHRKKMAKLKRRLKKPRPRLIEWAGKKLMRARGYKRRWLRERVTDRLLMRMAGQ
ncbi:MAG: hypothetical protein ACKVP0_04075 [Pirellulaceae bacterium]